ncbi:hypothetical protein DT076_15175 [Desertihabitans brevis]|uniref:Uncharacterized protein n=1 Tax=Desertihabitans brevis TaxID=2268447 RepID=A0A367YRW3_9ACTN|nr:DUF6069 family protein [Desertihabitans brevis]RCK68574.1 hypothetical protein DT076_15175 [Desertihabitans brevis]
MVVSVRRALLVLPAAVAVAALVWTLAVVVGGLALTARTGAVVQTIGLGSVLAAAAVAGSAGWAVASLLTRVSRRARTVWTVLACLVAVLSLAGPLTAGTTPGAVAVLVLLHLVVAAVVVPGLAPRQRAVAGAV